MKRLREEMQTEPLLSRAAELLAREPRVHVSTRAQALRKARVFAPATGLSTATSIALVATAVIAAISVGVIVAHTHKIVGATFLVVEKMDGATRVPSMLRIPPVAAVEKTPHATLALASTANANPAPSKIVPPEVADSTPNSNEAAPLESKRAVQQAPMEGVPAVQPTAERDEATLLKNATRLLRVRHDPVNADVWLAAYFRRYSDGTLLEEASVVAIESAVAQGDLSRATMIAMRYLNRFPNGRFHALAETTISRYSKSH